MSHLPAQDNYNFVVQLENGISSKAVTDQLTVLDNCDISIRRLSEKPNIMIVRSSCNLWTQIGDLNGLLNREKEIQLDLRETTPNDEFFGDQWQMNRIGATKVWDFDTGGMTSQNDEIVVAVLDLYYYPNHPDLRENVWVNRHEIPDDGIDNDGNGYIDDYQGFHFVDSTDTHTTGGNSHGTAVTGIIGATGDNDLGVAGVNWSTKVMMLDPINPNFKVEEAMLYIYNLRKKYNQTNGMEGAYVVALNMSFGATGKFADKDFPIMCALMDSLGKVGILSVAAGPNFPINIDEDGDLPNDCKSPYLISVTNTDFDDDLVSNAGYGPINIDLSGPGDDTYTTKRDSAYANFTGASAAAPYITGSVALLYASACDEFVTLSKRNPGEAASLIRQAIFEGVDPVFDLEAMSTTEGRLNIYNSLNLLKASGCSSDSASSSQISYITIPQNGQKAQVVLKIGSLEAHTVQLFDAAGRLWMEQTLPPTLSSEIRIDLDISHYPSGGYVARLMAGNEEDVKKFVIVH